MGITINTSMVDAFLNLPPDQQLMHMLMLVGWVPIAVTFMYGSWLIWIDYIQNRWGGKQKYTLLAIDVPKGNDLSLRAVENLFTYFGGAHGTLNLIEAYWEGRFQLGFSFEIVSIDGYIQFLLRTPDIHRNLAESAIYSQYPDAEITEVNDYADGFPNVYPNDEWDIWGVEFVPARNHMFPIKTYKDFEHQMGAPEVQFKDPMASLMDLYSSLKKGEQIWWQLIVYPTGFDWMAEGEKMISKILREKTKSKGGITDAITGGLYNVLGEIVDMFHYMWGTPPEASAKQEEKDDSLKMMNLKPQEKKRVEAIQEKISKLGFQCKNRFIYVAKKELMNKPKGVGGFIGFMKQFMDLDLNNLRPDLEVTGTRANYFFKEQRINARKRKIMIAYKGRSGTMGRKRYILNIEELATLWHFPIEAVVKAPLIQKAPGRKSEPPMSLPFGEEEIGQDVFINETAGEDIFADETLNPPSSPKRETQKTPASTEIIDEDIFTEEEASPVEEQVQKKTDDSAEHRGAPPSNLPFA